MALRPQSLGRVLNFLNDLNGAKRWNASIELRAGCLEPLERSAAVERLDPLGTGFLA